MAIQSGGSKIHSKKVNVGKDIVGRDKIEGGKHIHYAKKPSQPYISKLPHLPVLLGRVNDLRRVNKALNRNWGVLINGPHGVGKTALALYAGHLASNKTFRTKIFLSAKAYELTSSGIEDLTDFRVSDYMGFLLELARDLGKPSIANIVDPKERANAVRRALAKRYALLIVDSLDGFNDEDRKRVLQFLLRLPRTCKAILTNRTPVDVDGIQNVSLDKLSTAESLNLTEYLAINNDNHRLRRSPKEKREHLCLMAHGNPLLIKWLAGQMNLETGRCRTVEDVCKFLEGTSNENDPLEYIWGDLLYSLGQDETRTLDLLVDFNYPVDLTTLADASEKEPTNIKVLLENLIDRKLLIIDRSAKQYLLPPPLRIFLKRKKSDSIATLEEREP